MTPHILMHLSYYPSQPPPQHDGKTPHVLIAGAGIGGLFFALLLERAGIPYQIFEQAEDVRPVGSVISLGANILPTFEQLGLYEELKAMALPCMGNNYLDSDLRKVATLHTIHATETIGYDYMILSRPDLYDLLLSKIPEEKIHLGKKIESMQQNREDVMIRCEDHTTYHGDVLVGADGAFSAVRRSLYESLESQNLLPATDSAEDPERRGYACLAGTTDNLDPEKFPIVTSDESVYHHMLGEKSKKIRYTWTTFNITDNRIAWAVISKEPRPAKTEEVKRPNSEWAPENCDDMIKIVKDFRVACGSTLGGLINATPKEQMSKVFLEDRLYETWNYGHTVLMGDAAHRMLPSSGQGPVCAMLDAVVLANCLYELTSVTPETISKALDEYKAERMPHVKAMYARSKRNARILMGNSLFDKCLRYITFNLAPQGVRDNAIIEGTSYRPQLTFLPQVENRGTNKILQQKFSKRYAQEEKQRRSKDTAAAV
ncbi:hypothetical protein EMPS_07017 [Entomortierella parvispora]|uniref:FAD-binding domain-containing protein n=1 Tax=Entomortierella parvispora TaxID=205924 RepID=A0A9P3HDE9_9FUNG|nr:hypothetical protein EMPS_07017 [Entomortierella parvispora]